MLTNEYQSIRWILNCIPHTPLYSVFISNVNTEYLFVFSKQSEYEYRRMYAYSLFNHLKDIIMIFIFSIQTHHGHLKLFIFSIRYTLKWRYSVVKTVYSKAKCKVFSMQFSMQFNAPRSIQYAIQYSVFSDYLYWY